MQQTRRPRTPAPRRGAPAAGAGTAAPPASPRQAARRSGPVDRLLDPELFRALSDPTRLRLTACIAKCGRACAVSEVAECCDVDLSVVSRHLKQLADAGVLEAGRDGRAVRYALRYAHVVGTLRALADAFESCRPGGVPGGGACGPGGCCG